MKTRAAVQTAERTIEIQEFAVPESVGPDQALLKVEACGMCGTDHEQYVGAVRVRYPLILGHEPVGRIAAIGAEVSRLWGVGEGDRVAIEPFAPCGICANCLEGHYQLCLNRFMYGYTPTSVRPGLWGGYSRYMVLRANSVVHKLPDDLSAQDAVLFNPLGAGFEWAYRAAGTKIGDSVLILGPGQRGLACVIACREAGAARIIVTGVARDAGKLALARELGATDTINVDEEDVVVRVKEITGGKRVDRAIDVSAFATQPILDAIRAVKPGGTIIIAAIKGMREVPGFVSDRLVWKSITMRGVLGVGAWAYEQAIRTIAAHRYPFEKLHSHTLGVGEVGRAMRLLDGEIEGESAVHITIVPEG